MMENEKTGKVLKYLVGLFAAAAVLILAGGARKAFTADSYSVDSAKVKAAALLYVPAAENSADFLALAEKNPELLLFAASDSELHPVEPGILE